MIDIKLIYSSNHFRQSNNKMLKSLFKPKWQHQDSQIRQQAIVDLDSVIDLEIIQKLAIEDPASELRDLALAKITDTKTLQNLLNSASTAEEWCRFAVRINQISAQIDNLVQTFGKAKSAWDKNAVSKAIASCVDTTLAEALMVASDDPDVIFNIVTQAKSIDFRLKVLAKIDDYDLLHRLSKKATNKRVVQLVRLKLKNVKEQQNRIDETLENAKSLTQSIGKLSKQTWFDAQYEAKVNALFKHWQELDQSLLEQSSPSKQQSLQNDEKEFTIFLAACQKIISGYRQETERAALVKDAQNKQSGLCAQLNQLIEEMNEPSSQSSSSFHAIQNAWNILNENWLQTVDISQPDPNINKNYQRLQQQLKNCFKRWNHLIENQFEIEQLFDNKPDSGHEGLDEWLEKWKKMEKDLGWPKEAARPELLNHWISEVSDIQVRYNNHLASQKKKARVLNQKLALLEKHCQQRNLIAANKLEHYLKIRSKELTGDFYTNFLKKRERIQEQLDELRDWHSFATSPKKQHLCEKMESLIKETMDPLDKAITVRELQHQWRELNVSDAKADDELWERFKKSSDTAYEPCLVYYAEKDKVKAENLKQKLRICTSVEQLIIESGWNKSVSKMVQVEEKQPVFDGAIQSPDNVKNKVDIDWKKIESFLQQTNSQWKKYQPIPENEYQSVQKYFNQVLKIVNDKLKEEKQRNLDARCELVEKTIKLLDLADISQSIRGAIHLQKRWKALGFTFYKADRKQWKLFRSALDKIFEKRDSLNQSHKDELNNNHQKISEISQQILQLCNLKDSQLKTSYEQYETIKQNWDPETELPKTKQKQSLMAFEKACQKYQEHFSGLKKRQQKLAVEDLLLGAELLSHAEEKILDSDLAKIGQDDLDKLKNKISQLSCDEQTKANLNFRLQSLLCPKKNQTGLNELLELILKTEIMLGINSPDCFKQQRMQAQLEQLQQGMGQAQSKIDKRDEVLKMLNGWVEIGFIDKSERVKLEARRVKIFTTVDL